MSAKEYAYQFLDDDWKDTRDFISAIPSDKRLLPVAIDTEAAFIFRKANGEVFHKYAWPGNGDVATLTTYLTSLANSAPERLSRVSAKGAITRQLFFLLRLLARAGRTRINVLEVGATIGENFHIIKNLIGRYGLGMEVHYVGIEISPGLCNFARMVHHNDPNFHMIASDGSELDRFPEQSFDIVLCQGVANFTHDPKRTLQELIRITRFATVLSVQVTERTESSYFTDGEKGWYYFVPTRAELMKLWEPFLPLYAYLFVGSDFHSMRNSAGGDDYYLGQDSASAKIKMEWYTLSRQRLFSPENREEL